MTKLRTATVTISLALAATSAGLVGCTSLPGSSPSELRSAERDVVNRSRAVQPNVVWAARCEDNGPDSPGPGCVLGFVPASDNLKGVTAVVAAVAAAAREWNVQNKGGDAYVAWVVPVGTATDGTLRERALVCNRGDAEALGLEFSIFGSDNEPTPEDFVRRAKRASCHLGPPDSAIPVFRAN